MSGFVSEFVPARTEMPPPVAGVVDVWRLPLDPPPATVAELARLLSPDEAMRVDRLRRERDRRRFTVCRATLRLLLGRYLGQRPAAIRFAYGRHEKPRLADPTVGRLEFNLSHSSSLALVAVTAGCPVGIDVEALRPLPDAPALARRFFSAAERAALAAYPEGERERAFYRCWTRKEAYLKAVGDGVAARLDRFDVSLEPADARLLAVDGEPALADTWSLTHIEPGPGYVGALALPGGPRTVRGWQWRLWS